MAQPIWNTAAGSIGSYIENRQIAFQFDVTASNSGNTLKFALHNGALPDSIGDSTMTISSDGLLTGTPKSIGISYTKQFTIRVSEYNEETFIGFKDRTFSISIVAESVPRFITATDLGEHYDSTWISVELEYKNTLIDSDITISLVDGELPPGLVIDNSGVIYGYADPPVESEIPINKTYTFVLKIDNSTQFSTSQFKIKINNQQTKSDFSGRAPAILNLRHSNIIESQYQQFYVKSSHLGTFKQGSSFEFKILGYDFDNLDLEYQITGLNNTGTLTYDSYTGWITGTLPIIGNNIKTVNFSAVVSNDHSSSQATNFTFVIQGAVDTSITWVSNRDLGTIVNGVVSTLELQAKSIQNLNLTYSISDGSLPPGLRLLETGEISGRVAFESNSIVTKENTVTKYVFTAVAVSDQYSFAYSEKQFEIKVLQKYVEPYDNLYMQVFAPEEQRALFTELMNDDMIVPSDSIYRPNDPYFGKSTNLIYQHLFGVPSSLTEDYIDSVIRNHYRRDIILGEIKTAVAKDNNGKILYEVVYSEIVDDLVNESGQSVPRQVTWIETIFDSKVVLYPASLENMRSRISEYIGNLNDDSILPLWMRTFQSNGTMVGFVPAVVLCYTKPGQSDIIKTNIQTKWQSTLNEIQFTVDRFVVDRSISYQFNPETNHWNYLPSGVYPSETEPRNAADSYVLFANNILEYVRCTVPTIGGLSNKIFTAGTPYSAQLTIINATTATIEGLPLGVTYSGIIVNNNYVVTLSGTPTHGNQAYSINVIATNACYGGVATFTSLVVATGTVVPTQCPQPIVNPLVYEEFRANIKYGPINYTILNATSATITGLPTGMVATGAYILGTYIITISGTPLIDLEVYNIKVSATNACNLGINGVNNDVTIKSGVVKCSPPIVSEIDPNEFFYNTQYTGKLIVKYATTAVVFGFPAGLTATVQKLGETYTFNFSGKPSILGQNYTFRVNTSRTCGGEQQVFTNYPAGTGYVVAGYCPTPSTLFLSSSAFQATVPYSGFITVVDATSVEVLANTLPTGISVASYTVVNNTVKINLTGTPTVSGQLWDIQLNATNNCSNSKIPVTVNNISAGNGAVVIPPCPSSTVVTVDPNKFQSSIEYNGKIIVKNATSATISGLPLGISYSGAASEDNYVFTLTGTPTSAGQIYNIIVNAINACSVGTVRTTNNIQAGSGTVGLDPCTLPTASTINPNKFQATAEYSGKIVVNNATYATVKNLPSGTWITTGTKGTSDYTINITGTPNVSLEKYTILVDAVNDCVGGTKTSVDNLSAGTGTVTAAPCSDPVVESITPNKFQATVEYSGTITVKNATYAEIISGLPSGLTVAGAKSDNNFIFTISGTPTQGLQEYEILVKAENVTSTCNKVEVTNKPAGKGKVLPEPCPTPEIVEIDPTFFEVGIDYVGTVIVKNATSATISGLPTGIKAVGKISSADYVFDITGKPDNESGGKTFNIKVDAVNNCAIGTPTAANALNAGSVKVKPPPCVLPVIPVLSKNQFQQSIKYEHIFVVKNATKVTLKGLPIGIVAATKIIKTDIEVTLSGVPPIDLTADRNYTITVTAINECGTTPSEIKDFEIAKGTVLLQPCTKPTIEIITVPFKFQKAVAFSRTVTVNYATTISITGVPTDIEFSINYQQGNAVVTFSGTPSIGGEDYNIKVTAKNECEGGNPTEIKNISIASGKVLLGACLTPEIPEVDLGVFQHTVAITPKKFTIKNATRIKPFTFYTPKGIVFSETRVGSDLEITLSGTPETPDQDVIIKATAENEYATCNITEATGTIYQSGKVLPKPCTTSTINGIVASWSPSIGVDWLATMKIDNATSVTFTQADDGFSITEASRSSLSGSWSITYKIQGVPKILGKNEITATITNECVGGTKTTIDKIFYINVLDTIKCATPSSPSGSNITLNIFRSIGSSNTYTINNTTELKITAGNFPAGVTWSFSGGQLTISYFTLAIAGTTYSVTFSAKNASTGCSATDWVVVLTLSGTVILAPCPTPQLISNTTINLGGDSAFKVGKYYYSIFTLSGVSYNWNGSNFAYPQVTLSAQGLPLGINATLETQYTASAGGGWGANPAIVLSGTVNLGAANSTYNIKLTIANSCSNGSTTTATLTLANGSGTVLGLDACGTVTKSGWWRREEYRRYLWPVSCNWGGCPYTLIVYYFLNIKIYNWSSGYYFINSSGITIEQAFINSDNSLTIYAYTANNVVPDPNFSIVFPAGGIGAGCARNTEVIIKLP